MHAGHKVLEWSQTLQYTVVIITVLFYVVSNLSGSFCCTKNIPIASYVFLHQTLMIVSPLFTLEICSLPFISASICRLPFYGRLHWANDERLHLMPSLWKLQTRHESCVRYAYICSVCEINPTAATNCSICEINPTTNCSVWREWLAPRRLLADSGIRSLILTTNQYIYNFSTVYYIKILTVQI